MIGCIIVIVLAFTWLGYESDWMRIRLPVGAISKPRIVEAKLPHHRIAELCQTYSLHRYIEPIGGWRWAWEHQHIVPEYHIELRLNGVTHKFNADRKGIVKEIIKVGIAPHKRQWEIYPPSHYAELGLGCWRSVIMPEVRRWEKIHS